MRSCISGGRLRMVPLKAAISGFFCFKVSISCPHLIICYMLEISRILCQAGVMNRSVESRKEWLE